MKVLVVDDFEIMRHLVKGSLNNVGKFEIEEAIDGQNALEKIEQAAEAGSPYQIIICDWNMPHLSGLQILEKCRASKAYATTPFIMVTAESESENIILAVKTGATDYITKPIIGDELTQKFKKIFSRLKII